MAKPAITTFLKTGGPRLNEFATGNEYNPMRERSDEELDEYISSIPYGDTAPRPSSVAEDRVTDERM